MKTFELHRTTDVSGVSGTGVVAEGCEFTCGTVSLRWLGVHTSISIWDSMDEMIAVHGHGGDTAIHWLYIKSNAAARQAHSEVPLDREDRSEPTPPEQDAAQTGDGT